MSQTSQTDPIKPFESVCSLSEAEKTERRKMIRSKLEPHLLKKEELPDGMAYEFAVAAREQVEELLVLERECCAPLSIELHDAGDRLRFEMRHPPESAQPAKRSWLGVVRSAGVGAVGSFVLFCVVPLGLAAAFGSAAVAPLLGLDNPWVIGAGAIVMAGGLLLFERRRAARSA